MLWATRSIHLFSAVVWLGGLLYMGGILYPVFQFEKMTSSKVYVGLERRFLGFVWMCVWTTAITGILLMLFSQRFIWGQYQNTWDYILLFKLAAFVLMVAAAISTADVVKRMDSIVTLAPAGATEDLLLAEHYKIVVRRRMNLLLGIVVLLASARMVAH